MNIYRLTSTTLISSIFIVVHTTIQHHIRIIAWQDHFIKRKFVTSAIAKSLWKQYSFNIGIVNVPPHLKLCTSCLYHLGCMVSPVNGSVWVDDYLGKPSSKSVFCSDMVLSWETNFYIKICPAVKKLLCMQSHLVLSCGSIRQQLIDGSTNLHSSIPIVPF